MAFLLFRPIFVPITSASFSNRHSSSLLPFHCLPRLLSHSFSLSLSKIKNDLDRGQLCEVPHKENKRHWHNSGKIWHRATAVRAAFFVCVGAMCLQQTKMNDLPLQLGRLHYWLLLLAERSRSLSLLVSFFFKSVWFFFSTLKFTSNIKEK